MHLIFDFETFGVDSERSLIVDCAWLHFSFERFTSDKPYTFKELVESANYAKLDIEEQKTKYGYTAMKSTLDWWKKLPSETRKKALPSPDDVTMEVFLAEFFNFDEFIHNKDKLEYWWSRGNTFDPKFLERICRDVSDEYKLKFESLSYSRVRDVRTWIDAKLNFPKLNGFQPVKDPNQWKDMFEAHNPRHDIAADVMRLQVLARVENDLDY